MSITIDTNLVETDFHFQIVTFYLSTGKCYPYNKANNAPLYIHANSKHPFSIVMKFAKIVNKRMSDLSCDESKAVNSI